MIQLINIIFFSFCFLSFLIYSQNQIDPSFLNQFAEKWMNESDLLLFNHHPVFGHPVVELLNDGLLKLEFFR